MASDVKSMSRPVTWMAEGMVEWEWEGEREVRGEGANE